MGSSCRSCSRRHSVGTTTNRPPATVAAALGPVWEPQEVIDGDDKVVAFIRTAARGKGSGVEVEAYVWNLWTFRDANAVEFKYFCEDRAAALEAAGLLE